MGEVCRVCACEIDCGEVFGRYNFYLGELWLAGVWITCMKNVKPNSVLQAQVEVYWVKCAGLWIKFAGC